MADLNKKIAVLGCGLIGQSWSALFTAFGYDVAAWDPSYSTTASLEENIARSREQVRMTGRPKEPGIFQIARTPEEAVENAFWVQENAPESIPIKRELFERIEPVTGAETIVASSTSSFTWSQLASGLRDKTRFITAHPFNPPHIMPLVEIYAADDAAKERAVYLYQEMGRVPVVLSREAVGHIANRLASALWREAVNVVAEGIADVASVDAALMHGPGLRWSVSGAHMAYHLGGGPGGIEHYLKHLGPSQERRWATLGTPRLTAEVCTRLIEGIVAEAGGRSIDVLEAERDRSLLRVLAARDEGQT
jgi:3-hydroxyacyl-CoA dehydrogenase